ncbi:MAG: hypothetical protein Athens071416_360 [Parcubacteria group bacterium Athens0714_16]|nr:MAG: hypothetical protein Athens071416_360 [Parcubacteria group bacterium Athens0714_16]
MKKEIPKTSKTIEITDKNRRNFIKILLIGGGTLLVGKLLSPWVLDLFSPEPGMDIGQDLKDFNIKENKKEIIISDKKSGEEIFIIDKVK